MKKSGLGRGLDALFEDNSQVSLNEGGGNGITELSIGELEPDRDQARKIFRGEEIEELAASIEEHGIITPLIVTPENNRYKIVAGERRWRAAMKAGLKKVPVYIRKLDDKEAAEISLIDNLQRENLSPMEEANGYRRLQENFAMTQEEISRRVGKSRPYIANALRLLALPEKVSALVNEGKLTTGHAKVLLSVEDRKVMTEIAQKCAEEGLSVRELEKAVADYGKKKPVKKEKNKDYIINDLEKQLTETMGRRVSIKGSRKTGKVVIDYYSEKDLDELFNRLKG